MHEFGVAIFLEHRVFVGVPLGNLVLHRTAAKTKQTKQKEVSNETRMWVARG